MLFQFVVFVCVMALLNGLVFQPLLRIYALRERQTSKRELEAQDIVSRAQSIVERYDQSLAETRSEADRKIRAAIQEAQREAKVEAAKAREQAQKYFFEQRTLLIAKQAKLAQSLEQEVEKVADGLVATVVA
jgi:F-type H+-transporting ATPase subunit b